MTTYLSPSPLRFRAFGWKGAEGVKKQILGSFLLAQVLFLPLPAVGQDTAPANLVISNLSAKTPLDVRLITSAKNGPGQPRPDGGRMITEKVPVSGKVTIQIPHGTYTLVAGVILNGDKASPGSQAVFLQVSEDVMLSFSQNDKGWAHKKVTLAGFREFENTAGQKLMCKVISISDAKDEVQVQLESGDIRVIKVDALSSKDQDYLKTLPPTQGAQDPYLAIECTDGRTIKAQIVAVTKDSVQVRREDGRSFEIPLSQLTPACVEKIHASQSNKPAAPNAPSNSGQNSPH